MNDGIAIAIGVGAVVLVLYLTRKQEAQTAMRAATIRNAKANDPLTGGDAAAGIAAGVATYYGGQKAGQAVLNVSGKRL